MSLFSRFVRILIYFENKIKALLIFGECNMYSFHHNKKKKKREKEKLKLSVVFMFLGKASSVTDWLLAEGNHSITEACIK